MELKNNVVDSKHFFHVIKDIVLSIIGNTDIPMPIDLGLMDLTVMSYIDTIIGMNSFGFQYTASEIEEMIKSCQCSDEFNDEYSFCSCFDYTH